MPAYPNDYPTDTPLHELERRAIARLVAAARDEDWPTLHHALASTWLIDCARRSQPRDGEGPTTDAGGSTQTYDPPPMPDPASDPPSGIVDIAFPTDPPSGGSSPAPLARFLERRLQEVISQIEEIADSNHWLNLTATLATAGYLVRARHHLAAEVSGTRR